MPRKSSVERDAAIAVAVKSSYSIAQVLRVLGLRVAGDNYRMVHRAVKALNLDTSHWTGKGHRRGSHKPIVPAIPLERILVRDFDYNTNKLERRLIESGIFGWMCSACLLTEWRGGKIPLELDHIDGDRANNELRNLRLLCPNCHALTPTYRGRNKMRGQR